MLWLGGTVASIQAVQPHISKYGSIIITGGGYKDIPEPSKLALSVAKAAVHNIFLASKDIFLEKSINLKTVVIDGWVGSEFEKQIDPEYLADQFYILDTSPKDQIYVR
jgi:hypothetical protein